MKKTLCAICNQDKLTQVKELNELTFLPSELYREKNLFEKYDIYFCNECKMLHCTKKKWYHIKKLYAYLKSLMVKERNKTMKEIIKVLRITSDTVRGNGMTACAKSIDWAIKELEKHQTKLKPGKYMNTHNDISDVKHKK